MPQVEKTIKKRKKKRSELEELLSPDDNSGFLSSMPGLDKRTQVQRQIAQDLLISPDRGPHCYEESETLSDEEDACQAVLMDLQGDGDEDEMDFNEGDDYPEDSPPPATIRSRQPFESPFSGSVRVSDPVTIGSAGGSFESNNQRPLSPLVSSFSGERRRSNSQGVPPPSSPSSSSELDMGLLRQILTRLENLRKEHKKTTEMVNNMVEECRLHPELLCSSSRSEELLLSSSLPGRERLTSMKVERTISQPMTVPSPFPVSSSAPFRTSDKSFRSQQ